MTNSDFAAQDVKQGLEHVSMITSFHLRNLTLLL